MTGRMCSIPGQVIPKTFKMVPAALSLGAQHYQSRARDQNRSAQCQYKVTERNIMSFLSTRFKVLCNFYTLGQQLSHGAGKLPFLTSVLILFPNLVLRMYSQTCVNGHLY